MHIQRARIDMNLVSWRKNVEIILYPYVLLLSHIKVEFEMLLSYFTFINVFYIGLEFFFCTEGH